MFIDTGLPDAPDDIGKALTGIFVSRPAPPHLGIYNHWVLVHVTVKGAEVAGVIRNDEEIQWSAQSCRQACLGNDFLALGKSVGIIGGEIGIAKVERIG